MGMPHILIIGAGFTGAATAHLLRKRFPLAQIVVWDKARGPGGRMTTSRSPEDHFCQADLGAQYFSWTESWFARNDDFIIPLLKKKLLVPFEGNIPGFKKRMDNSKLFIVPEGTGSLVSHLLEVIPKQDVKFSHKVTAIEEINGKYVVKAENNESWSSDIVIVTIPVPQIFDLKGSITDLVNQDEKLKNVTFSSRFVLVQFYDKNVKLPELDWSCKFLEDDTFRFVSIDCYKRNKKEDPVAVVFHTHTEFGKKNLEVDKGEMEKVLLKKAESLFPDWPKPSAVKCHKWRYSQVIDAYEGETGCVVLRNRPTLILGGDSFMQSNLEGCCQSAKAILQSVISLQ